ncbi:g8286 [Coccomyxa viridis]|uniref:G8286 protein n=1 Tax=Coccomyxa viridis TaxID=1274662 RepID=A0ABP1G442_9CHLO
MTPSAGGCLAKTYTAEILQGRGHIALHVLGVEAAAGVESDVRKAFGLCKASKEGIMITTIKMRDVDDPVEKSLGTILEALRADDSELEELDRNFRSLPVYVDFQSSSGETRGTRRKTNVVAANAGDAKPAADVFSKGVIGAHSLPASRKTPVAWHSVCNQVMMQWYPRDEAGAYNRQTVEGVPDAWAEGMVSLIQLTLYERGMTGEDRGTIKQYMFRMAKDRHFKIHGGRPEERVSDQTIQKHAEEGKQWKLLNDSIIAAGHIPDALANANDKARAEGFLRAEGPRSERQNLLGSAGPRQTRAAGTKRSRQLQATNKPADKRGAGEGRQRGKQRQAPRPISNQIQDRGCKKTEKDEGAQAKAGQVKRAPRRRRAVESVAPASQLDQRDGPHTPKGGPAIKSEHTDAAEVAGHRAGGAQTQAGADEMYIDLTTEDEGTDLDGEVSPTHDQEQQSIPVVTAEAATADACLKALDKGLLRAKGSNPGLQGPEAGCPRADLHREHQGKEQAYISV